MEINPGKMPDLDSFRPYLTVLTRGHIPVAMQARLDASDIVQETMLEAHRKIHEFEGSLEPRQLAGWLRQLLVCNLLDAIKKQYRGQRDVRREQAIQLAIDESAMGLENILVSNDTSPSEHFDNRYLATRVAKAIEALPEQQRDAILLRYFQRASLQDMSERMQKSTSAVAGLLKRGLAALREQLKKDIA